MFGAVGRSENPGARGVVGIMLFQEFFYAYIIVERQPVINMVLKKSLTLSGFKVLGVGPTSATSRTIKYLEEVCTLTFLISVELK